MQRFLKGIPFLLAGVLAIVVYRYAVTQPDHISSQTLRQLQLSHPHGEVGKVIDGNAIQYEAYGKPTARQFRVQAFRPGTVEFFNADGKTVMKEFIEQGDILITVPKKQTIEAYYFEPLEWLE